MEKIRIEDGALGTREIDLFDDTAIVRDQHKVLCAWRDGKNIDGRKVPTTQMLLDDIRGYECMLDACAAETYARRTANDHAQR